MTEKYFLDRDALPTIPVPHDCVIDKITLENNFLVFTFEQDISHHDSIQYIKPDAESLVIKYHLIDDFRLYEWQLPIKGFAEKGCFRCINNEKLSELTESVKKTEYIGHFVAYKSMIIDLCAERSVRLEIDADYVEYIWKLNER